MCRMPSGRRASSTHEEAGDRQRVHLAQRLGGEGLRPDGLAAGRSSPPRPRAQQPVAHMAAQIAVGDDADQPRRHRR